jgi:hypothetical protein
VPVITGSRTGKDIGYHYSSVSSAMCFIFNVTKSTDHIKITD